MEKFIDFIDNFFATRRITYYIMLGISVAAIIICIASAAILSFAGIAFLGAILTPLGLIAFVGLSLLGFDRIGATISALCTFGSFVGLICGLFEHFLGEIQNQAMSGFDILSIKGFIAFVVFSAILLVLSVASNVLAWFKLSKDKVNTEACGKEGGNEK